MAETDAKNGTRTSDQVLQSVVKLFVQYASPNYCMPWQMKRQQQSFGSGFVIKGRRILTNAHVVKYHKSIRVRKHGDAKKYQAYIVHIAHDCDVAMVGVDDEKFWEDVKHLEFGNVPKLEEDVAVVGFPTGGDNISITRGVVSRVDIRRYSHSGQDLLAIQIDAAINSGNSGGPALQHGSVVGIAFQAMCTAENIGYIIPVPVITHFLDDVKTRNYFSGFCDLGVRWQAIEAEQMRSYFKLSADDTGVLIAKVFKLSCSHSRLKKGDVLMFLDGYPIADNGSVLFRGDERIYWTYLLHSKFPGQTIHASILRAGEKLDVEIRLAVYKPLVPRQLYDRTPSYVVYCGLVFVTLSQPYLHHQFGKDWMTKSPVRLCELVRSHAERAEQEVVLLSQVLASELTAGYEGFSNLQLFRVNGVPVLNLRHLCYLLDRYTHPHLGNEVQMETESSDIQEDEANLHFGIECNPDFNVGPKTKKLRSDGIMACLPSETDDVDKITSFGDIENDNKTETSPILDENERKSENSDVLDGYGHADRALFEEFTRESANLYTQVKEESLLLDCENFINFELDQDKIIVLKIKEAKKKSNDILRQHAITNPRSVDLPSCRF